MNFSHSNPEFQRRFEVLKRRDPSTLSVLERFILLPDDKKLAKYKTLTDSEVNRLLTDVRLRGRPDQQMPEELFDPSDDSPWMWLMNWGRGTGKTDTGGGWMNYFAETNPCIRMAIVGTTAAEVRDALLHGPSGLITTANPDFMPIHYPSSSLVRWPNGSVALTFSAEEPESLRSQQFHLMWLDELAKQRYQQQIWDQIPYVVRLTRLPGFTTWVKPIVMIGTTPRPTKLIKQLKADKKQVVTTTVSSFANEANLNSKTIAALKALQGTRLGRQEIHAELLDDNPNGVDGFNYENFDRNRITDIKEINRILSSLVKVVVAIDPAITATKKSDETGIIITGKDANGHGYTIHDGSMKGSPLEWAKRAINLYDKHGANVIVGEVNQGGDMVRTILESVNSHVAFKAVHASRGKAIRAEPVGTLYAQNKIHHLGDFPELETQMVEFNTEIPLDQQKSPDRMDALVWAYTFLFIDQEPELLMPQIIAL